ncbi:uncharacterized protein [Paramisgurnus dabryanus]|uniref:uncharacterized protein isoform X2 n=1 Tax=Paramisgurnus dabryanus TaxID=90735 RepID=UPI0031F3FA7E
MILPNRKVLAVVCWMMCVTLTMSQGSPPVPSLSYGYGVNESNIQLYTKVVFKCEVTYNALFPITLYIGKLESPSQSPETTKPWAASDVIKYSTTIVFTVIPQPTTEGDVVCWYNSTRNGQTSGFSNPLKLVISSLPPPKVSLHPKLFAFGGNYTVYCDSTADMATNFSMSLYYRNLPVTPNTTLISLGSVNLTGNKNRIVLTQKNVNFKVEFVCTMEMLYKGKLLRSPLSNFEEAIPEELSIQLQSEGRARSCLGNLYIKLRDNWKGVCQEDITTASSSETAAATALVACRELGCGHVIGWKRVADSFMSGPSTGGVRCNGSENKIRDCPMDDFTYCIKNALQIVCSDALPPPKLSVIGHGPVSKLYVNDKQSVDISCSFNSPFLTSYDTTDMVFRHNGVVLRDPYTRPNSSSVLTIYYPVPEGEYDCLFKLDRTFLSQPSNPVFIYIYNPPDPVPIVAGVLTTVFGAAILLYLCVFRATKVIESNETAPSSCDPEATNTHTTQPESNLNHLPQQL